MSEPKSGALRVRPTYSQTEVTPIGMCNLRVHLRTRYVCTIYASGSSCRLSRDFGETEFF